MKPVIGIGDLLRSLAAVAPADKTETEALLRCLRLEADLPHQDGSRPHTASSPRQRHGAVPGRTLAPRPRRAVGVPPAAPPLLAEEHEMPVQVEILPDAKLADHKASAEDAHPLVHQSSGAPPPRESFFPEGTARGVLTAALAMPAPGTELDVHRLIRQAVGLRPMRRLPLMPRRSTRNGVQLLLDYGPTAEPWREDMKALARQCQHLLGDESCETFHFHEEPESAIRWVDGGERVIWKPRSGRPTVIATDLGMPLFGTASSYVSAEACNKIAETCREAGSIAVLLTPAAPPSWPRGLAGNLRVIHWHPSTSAAQVLALSSGETR